MLFIVWRFLWVWNVSHLQSKSKHHNDKSKNKTKIWTQQQVWRPKVDGEFWLGREGKKTVQIYKSNPIINEKISWLTEIQSLVIYKMFPNRYAKIQLWFVFWAFCKRLKTTMAVNTMWCVCFESLLLDIFIWM